jgi:hypothetical protein
MKRGLLLLIVVMIVGLSGPVGATLWDRGGGLIYDDELNITWLQDATYARTTGYDEDGRMPWPDALTWVANLTYYDSVRKVTYNDWRLPTTPDLPENSTLGELGHLWYAELGNTTGNLTNVGPFINLSDEVYGDHVYWTSTEYSGNSEYAWSFTFGWGLYYSEMKARDVWVWPVRDGDVANSTPVALCKNVAVPADTTCHATASINNGSKDPDGDQITLNQSPAGPYPKGNTLVTLTVTDSHGASSQCQGTVTVFDQTPPTITSISANPSALWPPNHQMVPVAIVVNATDNCGGPPVCKIISVSSNEPINGLGDGDTAPDWMITGNLTVNLRSERSGKGNGRIYTMAITCTDTTGNPSSRNVTVTVPKNRGSNLQAMRKNYRLKNQYKK